MAIGKTAGCLILACLWPLAAAEFTVRHKHFNGSCTGILSIDGDGVSFRSAKGHAWNWPYAEIQQLKLEPGSIHILGYKDEKLLLGKDREYEFTGNIPADELYTLLRDRMDQRFVAAVGEITGTVALTIPAKHLRSLTGSEGSLTFAPGEIVYATRAKSESRTWRYADIAGVASAGPFDLTITTMEKGFHFQLKQPITEARYNQLWLDIERTNGRIQ